MYSDNELLVYLAKIIEEHGNISPSKFNELLDKPVTERVYRYRWGTWKKAKNKALNSNNESIDKNIKEIKLEPKEKGENEFFDFEKERLQRQVRDLNKEVNFLRKDKLTDEEIRLYLFELKSNNPSIPNWMIEEQRMDSDTKGISGVPSIQLSDWHFGEVVDFEQTFGKNKFNLEIGKQRVRQLAANTIDVLKNHLFSSKGYPGLVVLLNGDFISGNIHEELTNTNDKPVMPVILETYSILIWFLEQMIANFGNIMVFSTPGNHSRTTMKIVQKNKCHTSYDWLIYMLLEKHFENNSNINFKNSAGGDLQYNIYGHRYRLTHGDQFRGGTGFVGPYAPITRGEIKKRIAAETYGKSYDTLVIGHFHQLMHLNKVIVNGSLIGYNEYAMSCNFPYEPPQQALWITHPKYGITFTAPIFCETKDKQTITESWVSWEDLKE